MKIISLIVLITFTISSIASFWSPLWSQERQIQKIVLGVIPFAAAGVEEYEAVSLSNRLRSELVKTRKFYVVETEKIEEIIREQAFQQTGVINERYIAKVGNMLGAQYMMTGTVGKVGRVYTVDVYVTDVRTRTLVLTKTGNLATKEDLLNFMKSIALELANKKPVEKNSLKAKSSKAWLWTLGSAILIGGGVTAWMLMKNTNEPGIVDPIGSPPDPPGNNP